MYLGGMGVPAAGSKIPPRSFRPLRACIVETAERQGLADSPWATRYRPLRGFTRANLLKKLLLFQRGRSPRFATASTTFR